MEVNWEGAGSKVGIEVWRVENHRADDDSPAEFGIKPWPTEQYGQFHSGDSYIVLQTRQEEDSEAFIFDIYFWIGKDSSQDEYGVAAYKTVELDDLLGDAPVQHRETQYHESENFIKCFGRNMQYLDGGIGGGFRHVVADGNEGDVIAGADPRLYLIQKLKKVTRSIQIPIKAEKKGGLNHGDAFVLDCNDVVYTWFGDSCSPFEKRKAAEVGHNLVHSRNGHAQLVQNVPSDKNQDENAATFWGIIGCDPEDVPEEGDYIGDGDGPELQAPKLYLLSEKDSFIKVEEREILRQNLISDDVCLLDTGKTMFVWIGKSSSRREQSQAMIMAQKQITVLKRGLNTNLVRVLEGQEARVDGFLAAF